MIRLYKNQQIRDIESRCTSQGLIDEASLMETAGQAAFACLQQHWPHAKKVTVVCGKGNNAGDGFVLARLAHQAGLQVTVLTLVAVNELAGVAKQNADKGLAVGLQYTTFVPNIPLNADVIVDAVLGTGIRGEVTGVFAQAVEIINASSAAVLAIDVPSGVDVDTGSILGSAVQADVTITFIGHKQGLYTNKAPAYCGEVVANDLQIPSPVFADVAANAELLTYAQLKNLLPKRQRDANKGDYGHVLVIGGDYGMGGAVRMAAEAAMRVGAGLVSVATRPEHVPVVSGSRPEIMCHQVASSEDLTPLLERASVIVIGPGLGKSEWAQLLLRAVLATDLPMVLDADALNLLSQTPQQNDRWVLTPHPGEASRLLGVSCQDVQDDRFTSALNIQQRYRGVTVLKGVGTVIAGEGVKPFVCPAGNPGMASGGMGDILSGVIGGLLSQKLSPLQAAQTGVLVHAMAADCAAEEGGERGLLATDLLAHLRKLVNPDMLICDE